MKQYHDLMQYILDKGVDRPDRTGTGTRSVFGQQMRFDLNAGFPAITTKKLAWKALTSELLWFIEGSGDEKRLRELLHGDRNSEKGTIWTDNANADYWKHKAKFGGDLGRVYGVQWRQWRNMRLDEELSQHADEYIYVNQPVDQLAQLIDGLKKDPYGRRHILTAWNPGELDLMALPPCHMFAQFYVSPAVQSDNRQGELFPNNQGTTGRQRLSCQMYQRSCDMFLGVPFNIASYSLFTHMIAHVCDMDVGEFVWVGGDCHIYHDHFDQTREQLARSEFPLPILKPFSQDIKSIESYTMADLELIGYQSHGTIKAKMAV